VEKAALGDGIGGAGEFGGTEFAFGGGSGLELRGRVRFFGLSGLGGWRCRFVFVREVPLGWGEGVSWSGGVGV